MTCRVMECPLSCLASKRKGTPENCQPPSTTCVVLRPRNAQRRTSGISSLGGGALAPDPSAWRNEYGHLRDRIIARAAPGVWTSLVRPYAAARRLDAELIQPLCDGTSRQALHGFRVLRSASSRSAACCAASAGLPLDDASFRGDESHHGNVIEPWRFLCKHIYAEDIRA
jgi:hypothetical protein